MTKDSKSKLLSSAFGEFAKNGFFGATTRDIAGHANINISSILYYFGGKKGIYAAALQSIAETVNGLSADVFSRYKQVTDSADAAAARELMKELMVRFVTLMSGEKISANMKTVFFSEYSRPTEGFSILYNGLILPVHKMMAALLMQASGGRINMQDAYFYTFPLFSQLFVFGSRQETICSFMGWQNYGSAELRKICAYLDKQIDFMVDEL